MPAGETETSAPSLEQILWRAMDRFREAPALLDAEEFARHLEHAFDAALPEEAFADRFFAGVDRLHRQDTLAAAVVRAAERRLHVYEFDLDRLEYVIVEDDRDVVVVSEFGQFRVENDDALGRALEAAVVKRPERAAAEPRAYYVRASGEVLGVEVGKVARTLERARLRQVSMPPVSAPGRRLSPFNPVRREMTEAREERALEQRLGPSPGLPAGWDGRATIGSATRWERMLGLTAQPAGRYVVVQAGEVVAIVATGAREFEGERALATSETLAAVRGGGAPVQALGGSRGSDALRPVWQVTPGAPADPFCVQPEDAFLVGPAFLERTFIARPLQLGQITGDPWTDWTLTAAELPQRLTDDRVPLAGAAPFTLSQEGVEGRLQSRSGSLRSTTATPVARRGRGFRLEDAAVVAFRAPDGTLVVNRPSSPVPLGESDRPEAPFALRAGGDLLLRAGALPVVALRAGGDLVPRAGALPVVALRALQMALERTAAAGGYRLPATRIFQARNAIAFGKALPLRPSDPRRQFLRLAAPLTVADHAARLVVSMPFPNRGQLHVGQDLSEALHAYLAAPAMPLVHPASPSIGRHETPLGFSAAQAEAIRSGREALLTLELPAAMPLVAATPSIAGLPALLRRALDASGAWTAGPGAPLPLAVRDLVERSPFRTAGAEVSAPAGRRPPGPGEEEIVIPLPLWAQLRRGATDVVLAPGADAGEHAAALSPAAAAGGYAPPLGAYRLVAPERGATELTAGPASEGAWFDSAVQERLAVELAAHPGIRLERAGPGGLRISREPGRSAVERSPFPGSQAPVPARRPPRRLDSGAVVVLPEVVAGASEADSPERTSTGSPPESTPPFAAPGSPARAAASTTRSAAVAAPRPAGGFGALEAGMKTEPAAAALPAGSWSAERADAARGIGRRSSATPRETVAEDGILVTAPAAPGSRQVAVSLRFRYVGAPLWWSSGNAAQVREDLPPDAQGALRAGLGAANTAAALWRSVLVAGADPGHGAAAALAETQPSGEAIPAVPQRLEGL
ncbi:MAG: hypothetical protein ACXWLR_09495, partial [Myxococcales bacterium]